MTAAYTDLRADRRAAGPWYVQTSHGYVGITPDGLAETDRAPLEDAIRFSEREGAWSAVVRTGGRMVEVAS